jgi:hypothetical protein
VPADAYSFCSSRRGAAIKPCVPDGATPARISCELPARGSRPAYPGGWGRALPRPTPLAHRCAPAAPTPRAPSRAPSILARGVARWPRTPRRSLGGTRGAQPRFNRLECFLGSVGAPPRHSPGAAPGVARVGRPSPHAVRSLGRRRRRGRRYVRRLAAAGPSRRRLARIARPSRACSGKLRKTPSRAR